MNNFEYKSNQQKSEIMLLDCDISIRALNYLRSAGIDKLSDIINYSEDELRKKMPAANSRVFKEIKEILADHNLDFKSSE